MEIHTFDKDASIEVVWRRLPHWIQPGCVTFLTFRTFDSMPASVVSKWQIDRRNWLRRHDIDPDVNDWRERLDRMEQPLLKEFTRQFAERWHCELDECHGECFLKRPEIADIVETSLRYFDGERYEILDYVIMPNHVHLMASFVTETNVMKQCESWKRYMSTRINREIGRNGRFWQQDAFDHLVRNEDMFWYFRKYIAENPKKSGLRLGEFRHFSKELNR